MKRILWLGFLLPCLAAAQVNTVDHWENLVSADSVWQYFEGTQNPDTAWRDLSYNASAWSSGKGGFGYGDNDDQTVISTGASSVFVRREFTVADTSLIANLLLVMDFDDGFVAWINGKEIARKNIGMPGDTPSYDAQPNASVEAQLYQGKQPSYLFVNVAALRGLLNQGTNVLCIQVNSVNGSNDLSCIPYLYAGIKTATTQTFSYPSWFTPPLTTHLPIVVIDTHGNSIVDWTRITADMGIIRNKGQLNHITDSFNNYDGKIQIETRGSSSQSFPQKPYGFSTVDGNGNNLNVSLCGMPSEHDWIFYPPYTDKTQMRNNLIYDFARKMGNYAVRNEYVEMIINDSYEGIYVLQEKIKWDKDRVNIGIMTTTSNANDSLTGGYIFKIDKTTGAGGGQGWATTVSTYNNHANNVFYQYGYPKAADITAKQKTYIKDWMKDFETAMNGNSFKNTTTGYRKFMDVPSFIDFFIMNELSRNVDGYRLSTFMFKTRNSAGGKLVAGPLWDFNITLGNANYCDGGDTVGWAYVFNCDITVIPFWWDKLLTDNTYKNQLGCRWDQLRQNLLSDSSLMAYIDSTADYLRVPCTRNFARWNILGSYVWPNNYVGSTYQDEVDYMKKWLKGRLRWLDKNIPASSGNCYSAARGKIVVSEINYNSPSYPDPGNWVEIYNNSNSTLNLAGYILTDGTNFHSYTIPSGKTLDPGEYFVIAQSTTRMKFFYPNVTKLAGGFSWSFPNKNGRLVLYDPYYNKVFDVQYEDHAPWPPEADGKGKTMEMPVLGVDENDPNNWVAGCIGGSPGEPYGQCLQDIIFSEINFNSPSASDCGDWVELHNRSTTDTISISKWIFRDGDKTHGFVIDSGKVMYPGEYFVLCEDSAKFASVYPHVTNFRGGFSFGLSSKGDYLLLSRADSTPYNEMNYDDGKTFPIGANGTGYTLELINDTLNIRDGASWQLSCKGGSPAAPRQNPCYPALFAKVAFTEIHYNPHPGLNDGGFIEMINKDTATLDLSDWVITNGTSSYTFAKNKFLAPSAMLILAFDSAAFVKEHGFISNTYYASNFSLAAGGGILNLNDQTGTTAHSVQFQNTLGWTQDPNGWGYSLESVSIDSSGWNAWDWKAGILGGSPGVHPGKYPTDSLGFDEINYLSHYLHNTGDWLELKNNKSTASSLNGWKIVNETGQKISLPDTTLQPGSVWLLMNSKAQLDANFPTHAPGTELTALNLTNTGGRLLLLDGNDRLITSAKYEPQSPFPDSAAGGGYTLRRVQYNTAPIYGSAYSTACLYGSPGWDDAFQCVDVQSGDVVLNEMHPFPEASQGAAWLEWFNQSGQSVTTDHWFLHDVKNNTWQAWNGPLTIANGDYVVFTDDSASFVAQHGWSGYTWPGGFKPYGQWEITDRYGVVLHTVNTSGSLNWPKSTFYMGRSLERINTSGNETDPSSYAEGCFGGSPGTAYTPCAEDLVVSEINHNPDSKGAPAFIELYNRGTSALSLQSLFLVTDKQDTLTFPTPTTMNSGERRVLTGDTALLRKIQPFAVNTYEQNKFKLTPTEGFVKIFANGKLVENLMYSANFPWPQGANGDGFTLEWNKTLPLNQGDHWFVGCENGSPGYDYTYPCPTVVVVVTGELKSVQSDISIYPNPARDQLAIQGLHEGYTATWVSAEGKMMAPIPVYPGKNLSAPGASGLYELIIRDAKGVEVYRNKVVWLP